MVNSKKLIAKRSRLEGEETQTTDQQGQRDVAPMATSSLQEPQESRSGAENANEPTFGVASSNRQDGRPAQTNSPTMRTSPNSVHSQLIRIGLSATLVPAPRLFEEVTGSPHCNKRTPPNHEISAGCVGMGILGMTVPAPYLVGLTHESGQPRVSEPAGAGAASSSLDNPVHSPSPARPSGIGGSALKRLARATQSNDQKTPDSLASGSLGMPASTWASPKGSRILLSGRPSLSQSIGSCSLHSGSESILFDRSYTDSIRARFNLWGPSRSGSSQNEQVLDQEYIDRIRARHNLWGPGSSSRRSEHPATRSSGDEKESRESAAETEDSDDESGSNMPDNKKPTSGNHFEDRDPPPPGQPLHVNYLIYNQDRSMNRLNSYQKRKTQQPRSAPVPAKKAFMENKEENSSLEKVLDKEIDMLQDQYNNAKVAEKSPEECGAQVAAARRADPSDAPRKTKKPE